MPVIGLTNVARPLDFEVARTKSEVLSLIGIERALVASGSDAGMTIWEDDSGDIRVSFGRLDRKLFEGGPFTREQLGHWLDDWWPKMERFHNA